MTTPLRRCRMSDPAGRHGAAGSHNVHLFSQLPTHQVLAKLSDFRSNLASRMTDTVTGGTKALRYDTDLFTGEWLWRTLAMVYMAMAVMPFTQKLQLAAAPYDQALIQ